MKQRIAFDIKKMKVGCALLQATHGCNPLLADRFDTKYWLLYPTPNLYVYEVTEHQLGMLIEKVKEG